MRKMNENKQRVTSSTGQAPWTQTWVRVVRANLKQTQIYYSVGLHLELEMSSWCPPSSAAQGSFSDVIKSDAGLLPSTVNINSKHTKSCLPFSMIHIERKLFQSCYSTLLPDSFQTSVQLWWVTAIFDVPVEVLHVVVCVEMSALG